MAGVGASNIAIIDPAKLPEKPSAPNLKLNLALALLAGLVLSGLTMVVLNQIDEGFRDPNQITAQLKVPLLGAIPLTDRDTLSELRDAKSAIFEAYLAIRSNLAFSTDHGFPRTLAVTSTRPAEGKSTSCFALATVLARTGKRVILIDADMRSPSIHGMAGIGNDHGLSNYLAGDDGWQQLISPSETKSMAVLPAGPMPPNAGELLTGDRLHALLDQLLHEYDHVLIDSPPILGLADAPLLTRTVEGCVLVVESNGVAVRGVQTALRRLNDVHAHVLGVIFTKLDTRQSGYGLDYGYGYGYGRVEADRAT